MNKSSIFALAMAALLQVPVGEITDAEGVFVSDFQKEASDEDFEI